MSIAFLILTVDTPFKFIDYLIKCKYNIYIHPKNKIDHKYQKYVIPKIAVTRWMFLIDAIINLLEEALKNKENKYFMLVSGDSYLLCDRNKFDSFDPKLSCFSYSNEDKISGRECYKSSL